MNLVQIKQAVRRLSPGQLRRLDRWLQELIRKTDHSDQASSTASRQQVVDKQAIENRTYRLEGIRCGKEKCKCSHGKLHGPYWYSYTRVKGKIRSQYIGKKLPLEVEKELKKRNEKG